MFVSIKISDTLLFKTTNLFYQLLPFLWEKFELLPPNSMFLENSENLIRPHPLQREDSKYGFPIPTFLVGVKNIFEITRFW